MGHSRSSGSDLPLQPLTSVRILVVDDYEPWRRWVGSVLMKHPHLQVVGEASDGLEALQKAESLGPDIILLDIGLPNLNGIEAAARISRTNPSAKIIFLTKESDPDIIHAALSNGAFGYVLKDSARDELLPAIETVARGGRYVTRELDCPCSC